MDWQSLIEVQPFLVHVPASLRRKTGRRNMAAGDVLFRIGDPVRYLFCVTSGEVQLVRHDLGGGRIVLQRSRSGFVAEASTGSKVYHCDAVAAEGATLLYFPLAPFLAALEQDTPFRNMWMGLLAREVRRLRAKCERMSLHGAAERIIHFLESEGDEGSIVLNQSRKAWAAELGLSHETLYRTLKRLAAEGVVRVDGARIVLVRGEGQGVSGAG